MKYLALAAFTLVVILLVQRFGRGFLKQVALLVGMFVGTLAAIPFGLADFSALKSAPLAALPTLPSPSALRSSSPPRSSRSASSCSS